MVEFVLKSSTANRLVYEYYPKGDEEKLPGIISVWINKRDVVLDIAAEDDFVTFSTTEEINKLKDSLDEIYEELGMIPDSDYDWDFGTYEYDWYYYAEKVMQKLRDNISNGKVLKRGILLD